MAATCAFMRVRRPSTVLFMQRRLAGSAAPVWFEELHRSKAKNSRARVGRLHTPHGSFFTPGFVPVATNAAVKGVSSRQMRDEVYQDSGDSPPAAVSSRDELMQALNESRPSMMFCNTYHLLVHPGADVVAKAGGLHSFMGHKHPIITDSGGFQVFSLAYGSIADERHSGGYAMEKGEDLHGEDSEAPPGIDVKSIKRQKRPQFGGSKVVKISEEGVRFKSYRDGSILTLTPESSVQAQKALGADIIIPLDELPPHHISAASLRDSFDRTHRWQERSLAEHTQDPREQAMFGVVHGGMDPYLRQESVQLLTDMGFDGYAIGMSFSRLLPFAELTILQVGAWERMRTTSLRLLRQP